MDANPIAVGDMASWIDLQGFTEKSVRLMLYQYIRFLDDEWLKLYIKDPKRKPKKKKGQN